jgi:D-allose transport system substrate-binding protein
MFAKSRLYSILSFCLIAWAVAASSAYAAQKCIFVIPSIANPYWQTVKQGVEDCSKETGVSSVVLPAASNQAKEEFINLCQSAIVQNPAIIIVCTTTDTITMQCLREIQDHHIKAAVLDTMLPEGRIRQAGVNLSFSVGADNVQVGEKAAKFVSGCNKSAAPKILVLEGELGSTANAGRVSGF